MTVLKLIKASLRVIGAIGEGETPTGAAGEDARQALNLLLQEWYNNEIIAFTVQATHNTVAGQRSYGIGPGQEWFGDKPLKVNAAYVGNDDVDKRLQIIGEKEYMNIEAKTQQAKPQVLYYRPHDLSAVISGFQFDCGRVYLYPTPDTVYPVTIMFPKSFYSYESNAQAIDLDAGYITALKYALAVEVAPEYGREPSAWVLKRAAETLVEIKKRKRTIPQPVKIDGVLTGNAGRFNIYSGTYE
jgi:hypothetical protein